MRISTIIPLAIPATILLTSLVWPNDDGYYNSNATRRTNSCGQCHRSSPGAPSGSTPLSVSLTPGARSLTPGQSISVRTTVTGGQTQSGTGGFATDATNAAGTKVGTFAAGANTKTESSGTAIVHSNPNVRSWGYGFNAPTTPGLIKMYTVALTANGDGRRNSSDYWAFHGFDQTDTTSTPVRLFVNANAVTPVGQSCVGSFGNYPVFGADVVPAVGSAFAVQIHGTVTGTPTAVVLGTPLATPLQLDFLGVTGCNLYVQPLLSLFGGVTSTTGSAQRGDGSVTVPVPLPNNPGIRGASIDLQGVIVDPMNGRRTAITMTNALSITVQ